MRGIKGTYKNDITKKGAAYVLSLRVARAKAGLCIYCGVNPVPPGRHKGCVPCRADLASERKLIRANAERHKGGANA